MYQACWALALIPQKRSELYCLSVSTKGSSNISRYTSLGQFHFPRGYGTTFVCLPWPRPYRWVHCCVGKLLHGDLLEGWLPLVELEVLSAVLQCFRIFLRFSSCSVVPQRPVRDTPLLETRYRQLFSCDFARTQYRCSLLFFFPSSWEGRIICSISIFFPCIIFLDTLALAYHKRRNCLVPGILIS